MENNNNLQLATNSFSVTVWEKEDYTVRVLGIDLGYTYKMLCFKTMEIAEILGISVRELVAATPVVSGKKTRYKIEVPAK